MPSFVPKQFHNTYISVQHPYYPLRIVVQCVLLWNDHLVVKIVLLLQEIYYFESDASSFNCTVFDFGVTEGRVLKITMDVEKRAIVMVVLGENHVLESSVSSSA